MNSSKCFLRSNLSLGPAHFTNTEQAIVGAKNCLNPWIIWPEISNTSWENLTLLLQYLNMYSNATAKPTDTSNYAENESFTRQNFDATSSPPSIVPIDESRISYTRYYKNIIQYLVSCYPSQRK